MDLALNNLQRLICHKTQTNMYVCVICFINHKIYQLYLNRRKDSKFSFAEIFEGSPSPRTYTSSNFRRHLMYNSAIYLAFISV